MLMEDAINENSPEIDEADLKMPESSLALENQKKSSHVFILAAASFLLALLTALAAYIYYGMNYTPYSQEVLVTESSDKTLVEVVDENQNENVASPESVVKLQKRLEEIPPANPEDVAKFKESLLRTD